MRRALRRWVEGAADSLTDGVRVVRDQARAIGRRRESRSVSRVVLVKGQEYDHCVVVNADALASQV